MKKRINEKRKKDTPQRNWRIQPSSLMNCGPKGNI